MEAMPGQQPSQCLPLLRLLEAPGLSQPATGWCPGSPVTGSEGLMYPLEGISYMLLTQSVQLKALLKN